jgi:hypothetical protein
MIVELRLELDVLTAVGKNPEGMINKFEDSGLANGGACLSATPCTKS